VDHSLTERLQLSLELQRSAFRAEAEPMPSLAEHFKPGEMQVITGEAAVGEAFAALPFDHLLFTGSTAVGRAVAKAAAQHLTPATLELGGKSPVLVDRSANLALIAERLAFGKLLNAGQTCIAPDYVLAPKAMVAPLAEAPGAGVRQLYPPYGKTFARPLALVKKIA
jgi:coniferyl-aldehyde dehydrogenase